jgi:hypothetical protein
MDDNLCITIFGEILHFGKRKKKPWQIQQRAFWEIFKRKLSYLEKKEARSH